MYHSRLCYPPGYAAVALAFNDMLLAIAAVPQKIYSILQYWQLFEESLIYKESFVKVSI